MRLLRASLHWATALHALRMTNLSTAREGIAAGQYLLLIMTASDWPM